MHFDRDPFKQAGLFQCLPATQDGVADNGVVLLVESWRQRLENGLLGEKFQRTKALVGEEGVVGNAKLQAQVGHQRFFVAGRERVAQPFPRIPELLKSFSRASLRTFGSGLRNLSLAAANIPSSVASPV